MHSKVDNALSVTGQSCLTLGALLLAFGAVSGPSERPWIAYGLLVLGALAYGWLATQQTAISTTVRAAVSYSVFGAVCGLFAFAIGRAVASQSWGVLVLLLMISMLVAGFSFWLRAPAHRDR